MLIHGPFQEVANLHAKTLLEFKFLLIKSLMKCKYETFSPWCTKVSKCLELVSVVRH